MLSIELLSEPVHVPDTNVAGLAHVEDMGDGQYRLTFFSKRLSPYGGYDYPIEVRMIATYPVILSGVVTVMTALGKGFCEAVFRAVYGGRTVH